MSQCSSVSVAVATVGKELLSIIRYCNIISPRTWSIAGSRKLTFFTPYLCVTVSKPRCW